MPAMSPDRSPQDLAAHAAGAAQAHDVVIATSKLLHGLPLEERDRESLQWAKDLLDRVLAAEAVVAVPSADELVSTDDTLALLRRRARFAASDDVLGALGEVRDGLDALLAGRHDERSAASAADLRELFSMLSTEALRAQVDAHTGKQTEAWQRSTMSLSS